jgi:hypothetical protein
MKYKFTIIPLLFLTAFIPRNALSDSSEAETKAVRNVQTQQQDAWNRHDAKAYASLFAEDGDCVNVVAGGERASRD